MKIEAKTTLNKIRVLLNKDMKLAQMKLEDGVTILEAEEFLPEYSVGIVAEDGIVALEVGVYTLEDGQVLTVEETGVIASVEDAPTEEEATEEVAPEEATPEAETEMAAPVKKTVESVTKETFFSKEEADVLISKVEELEMSISNKDIEIEALKSSLELAETPVKTVHNPEAKNINMSSVSNQSLLEFLNSNK
jgi:hypothetical protein